MKTLKLFFSVLLAAILFNSCAKEYSLEHLLPPTGSWSFTNGGSNYSGSISRVYQTGGTGNNTLIITGKNYNNTESFNLKLFGNSFAPGTYKASQFQCAFLYNNADRTIYEASETIGEFIVNLTVLDSAHISGTFSGTARDSADNLIQISEGKFSVQ